MGVHLRTLALSVVLLGVQATAWADPDAEDARRMYVAGTDAFRAGRYDEAIDAFRKAYEITGAPELLFDIAQSYRKKGTGFCSLARQFFERYIAVQTDADKRRQAEVWSERLQSCAAEEDKSRAIAEPLVAPHPPPAASPPPASPAPVDQPPPSFVRFHLTELALGATGVTALATGAVLWATTQSIDRCTPHCDPTAVDPIATRRNAASALMLGGGALVTGAAVIWLLRPSRPDGAAVQIVPGPGSVTVVGHFQ